MVLLKLDRLIEINELFKSKTGSRHWSIMGEIDFSGIELKSRVASHESKASIEQNEKVLNQWGLVTP